MRFPGFEGEWEETPIRDLLDFQNGVNATADKYGSGIKYISVSDILNSSYITYDAIKGLVDIDNKTLNNFSVNYGDILFQRSSETQGDIGRSNVYLDCKTATFGGFVIRGKKIGEYNPVFFKHLLDTQAARKEITRLGAGAQHYNIGQDSLRTVQLYFPTIQEQNKISELLLMIDKKISLCQKYIGLLKSYKRGLLRAIFTQKMRTGFLENVVWRDVCIGDILEVKHGRDYKDQPSEKGIYPVVGTGGQIARIDSYLCDWPCVCIGRKGTINKPQFYDTPFWSVDTLFYTKPKYANDPKFQYYLFETIPWATYNEASGVPSLSASTIEQIPVEVPSEESQKRIAQFLSSIDAMIATTDLLLARLVQTKQSFLQQLFI